MEQTGIWIVAIVAGCAVIRLSRLLTCPATVIAAVLAVLLLYAGGWSWLTPALIFLITSSIWTRWPGASRARDRTRRARQVLANGFVPMLFSVIAILRPDETFAAAVAGGYAAAAADTWATEWGGKFGGSPMSLRTFRRVQAGQSGAVSVAGSFATAAGAATVAAGCALMGMISWPWVLPVSVAGAAGSLLDSLAGAWIQGLWKAEDGTLTEIRPATKGKRPVQGWRWIDNDAVNFIATLAGAVFAIALLSF